MINLVAADLSVAPKKRSVLFDAQCTNVNIHRNTSNLRDFQVFRSILLRHIRGSVDVAKRITYELCEDLSRQGVVYAELRYCPHLQANAPGIERVFPGPEGTITPRDIVRAVNEGIRQGEKDFGIRARSILCMLRDRPGNVSVCAIFYQLIIKYALSRTIL